MSSPGDPDRKVPPEFFQVAAAPPSKPKGNRPVVLFAVLGLIGALVVAGVVVGAMFFLLSSRSPGIDSGDSFPADGKRHLSIRWAAETSPVSSTLRAVWISGNDAYAVGDNGVVLYRGQGGAWSVQPSGTQANLHSIQGLPASVYAVGDQGTVIHFDDQTRGWRIETTETKANLYAVARSGGTILAAGAQGTILQRGTDGRWTAMETPTDEDNYGLAAVRGPGGKPSVYAVGNKGTILFLRLGPLTVPHPAPEEAPKWIQQSSGTQANLRAIVANRAGLLYVVGANGTVLQSSATRTVPWAPENPGVQRSLGGAAIASVRFSMRSDNYSETGSTDAVVAVGSSGLIALREIQPGGSWSLVDPSPAQRDLLGAAASFEQIYAVGKGGTILRASSHDRPF